MSLGADTPESEQALRAAFDSMAEVDRDLARMPHRPDQLGEPRSELAELVAATPKHTVSVQDTIFTSFATLRACLNQIRMPFVVGLPYSPRPLAILTRAALVSASRLILLTAPPDLQVRRGYAERIARAECESLDKLDRALEGFTSVLHKFVPEPVELDSRRACLSKMRAAKIIPISDTAGVKLAAGMVDDLIRAHGAPPWWRPDHLGEHLLWVFHNYSGVAHGFGWQHLIVRTGSLPGDPSADMWTVSSVGWIAAAELWRAHRAR